MAPTEPAPLPKIADLDAPVRAAQETAREAKREAIRAALELHGGNRTRAAEALGYASARSLRQAAVLFGVDLEAIPAPTPQEVGGLRLETPRVRPKKSAAVPEKKRGGKRVARKP